MTPEQIHAEFAKKAGASQIASAFACRGLYKWLRKTQPYRIYEVGGGIGTLSKVILSALDDYGLYRVEEENDWCRSMWRNNVSVPENKTAKTVLLVWPEQCAATEADFLVIDAVTRWQHHRHLGRRAVVFVEGQRRGQCDQLERDLDLCGRRWTSATFRPPDRSKGYTVYQLEPTLSEKIWFAIERVHQHVLDDLARLRGRAIGKKGPQA